MSEDNNNYVRYTGHARYSGTIYEVTAVAKESEWKNDVIRAINTTGAKEAEIELQGPVELGIPFSGARYNITFTPKKGITLDSQNKKAEAFLVYQNEREFRAENLNERRQKELAGTYPQSLAYGTASDPSAFLPDDQYIRQLATRPTTRRTVSTEELAQRRVRELVANLPPWAGKVERELERVYCPTTERTVSAEDLAERRESESHDPPRLNLQYILRSPVAFLLDLVKPRKMRESDFHEKINEIWRKSKIKLPTTPMRALSCPDSMLGDAFRAGRQRKLADCFRDPKTAKTAEEKGLQGTGELQDHKLKPDKKPATCQNCWNPTEKGSACKKCGRVLA
jgi:hypothetical protein